MRTGSSFCRGRIDSTSFSQPSIAILIGAFSVLWMNRILTSSQQFYRACSRPEKRHKSLNPAFQYYYVSDLNGLCEIPCYVVPHRLVLLGVEVPGAGNYHSDLL